MTGDCQESASFQLLTTCKFLIDIEAMKKGRTGNPQSAAKKSMNQRAIIEELVKKTPVLPDTLYFALAAHSA